MAQEKEGKDRITHPLEHVANFSFYQLMFHFMCAVKTPPDRGLQRQSLPLLSRVSILIFPHFFSSYLMARAIVSQTHLFAITSRQRKKKNNTQQKHGRISFPVFGMFPSCEEGTSSQPTKIYVFIFHTMMVLSFPHSCLFHFPSIDATPLISRPHPHRMDVQSEN